MNAYEMLGIENTIFILESPISNGHKSRDWPVHRWWGRRAIALIYLTCCVNDLSCVFLALKLDNLAEGVLNCWIVALYEMSIDELYCHRGLA
jgi:hypothetical protein